MEFRILGPLEVVEDGRTNYDAGTVVRVDPTSGTVTSTIKVGGHPFGIAFGDNRIWVTVS